MACPPSGGKAAGRHGKAWKRSVSINISGLRYYVIIGKMVNEQDPKLIVQDNDGTFSGTVDALELNQ
ncbi:MAG: hypothetical protein BWY80_00611 [Firmicutes bacterium ADurb.Bin456]|nr:MAG: hypothetical protein BWY80_00611 [Firmicutes bacterium ADurb.Bin456]